MKDCPEKEELFEYALAGLEETLRAKVRKHLSMCKGCQDQIIEYALVSEGLALEAPPQEPPASLESGVMSKIRQEREARSFQSQTPGFSFGAWGTFWMRLGPVFAVMALVMTGMSFLYMQKAAGFKEQNTVYAGINPVKLHSLMSESQVQTISMKGVNGKTCSGSITCAKDSKYLLLSMGKLKKCPLGRVYVVWQSDKDGQVKKIATFVPQDGKPENILIELDHDLGMDPKMQFKVTLQDEASDTPEGELHLVGGVSL